MKKKRKILNSPKDGPIATHLQVQRITNRSNPPLPRPFSSILPKHSREGAQKKKKKKKAAFLFLHARSRAAARRIHPRKWTIATEVGGAIVEQNCCRFPVPSRVLVPVLARKPERRCDRLLLRRASRADSRNRARENERRRARVVAVWPGTGGHPAVYLPFDATCWIQRAKHGRGGGERSTSARGVATPTPTRAVCKRSSVKDEAEGRYRGYRGSRIDFFQEMRNTVFLEGYCYFLEGYSSGYLGIYVIALFLFLFPSIFISRWR